MNKKEPENHVTSQLRANVTEEERELFKKKARHYGMTISSYLRKLILDDLKRK